jgi:hypothetical protein
METEHIGRHRVQQLGPRLVYVIFDGNVSGHEAGELFAWFARLQRRDLRLLIDVRRLGMIDLQASRALACEPVREAAAMHLDMGFIGASMRARVLLTLAMAAARVALVASVSASYFNGMQQGLAWAGVDEAAISP